MNSGGLWKLLLELHWQHHRLDSPGCPHRGFLIDSWQLLVAIEPIKTAMLRLDPSTTCFTSTHLLFAHMCLQTRAYTLALPILGNDIFHFPRHTDKTYQPLMCSRHATSATFITAASGISDKLNYRDHLLYFLYGAMIYMVVKDWERALHFLEIVITAPVASGASMIQVEAFKKWILAGLLSKGRVSMTASLDAI